MGCTEITVEENEVIEYVEITNFDAESIEGTTSILVNMIFENKDSINSHTANLGLKLTKVNDINVSVSSLWNENDVEFDASETIPYNDISIDIVDYYPEINIGDVITLRAMCVDNYDGHFTYIDKTITLGKKTETDYMKYAMIGAGILVGIIMLRSGDSR